MTLGEFHILTRCSWPEMIAGTDYHISTIPRRWRQHEIEDHPALFGALTNCVTRRAEELRATGNLLLTASATSIHDIRAGLRVSWAEVGLVSGKDASNLYKAQRFPLESYPLIADALLDLHEQMQADLRQAAVALHVALGEHRATVQVESRGAKQRAEELETALG